MRMLLAKEKKRGKFLFLIEATLVSQSGKKTQNTFSTGNRTRQKIKKGCRYNKKKVVRKNAHSFTFGLLLTPSGIRIPMQIPHRTKEYCAEQGINHLGFPSQPRAGFRGSDRPAAQATVSTEGLDESVAKDHQEKRAVRSVGNLQIVFSTMKPDLEKATADDVKILLTSAPSKPG